MSSACLRQNTRYESYDIGMITHAIAELTDPGVDETEESQNPEIASFSGAYAPVTCGSG